MRVASSLGLFALAGLCEIGGGYLVWQWWRKGASPAVGALGAAVLILSGIIERGIHQGAFHQIPDARVAARVIIEMVVF